MGVYRSNIRESRPIGDALSNDDLVQMCDNHELSQGTLAVMTQSTMFPSSAVLPPPPPAVGLPIPGRNISQELKAENPGFDISIGGGYEASDESYRQRLATNPLGTLSSRNTLSLKLRKPLKMHLTRCSVFSFFSVYFFH
jgi:hypothetical protein